jgi:hypothetical protein
MSPTRRAGSSCRAGTTYEARDVTVRLVGREDHDAVVEQELPNINEVLAAGSKGGLFRFHAFKGLPDDVLVTDPSCPGGVCGCTFLNRAAKPDKWSDRHLPRDMRSSLYHFTEARPWC